MWIAGLLLLSLLGWEIFRTVFHPHAHAGPINRLQNRLVWRGWSGLVTRMTSGKRRHHLLAVGGPALAVITLAVWAVLLVIGFALIYPSLDGALAVTEGESIPEWLTAVYFSAYVLSTLGLGDVIPATATARVVTVVEALAGTVLIPVVVTYIVAVYGAHREAASVATQIDLVFGEDPEGVAKHFASSPGSLDSWAGDTARQLVSVLHAHAQYPILHYFRAPDPAQAVVVQLGRLLVLLEAIDTREANGDEPARTPSLVALRGATQRYLEELDKEFVNLGTTLPDDADPDALPTLRERHRRALRHLRFDVEERPPPRTRPLPASVSTRDR